MTSNAIKICAASSFTIILSFLIIGCSGPDGNPADGKRWYMMHNCYSCHGPHGNDGRAVDIAQPDIGFGGFVRKLRTKNAPIMPHFPASKVSKQDAADIYAYLNSVKE